MKKLFWALVAIIAFAGCELNPKLQYYDLPTIENIEISPDLTNVTASDEVHISASVTNHFGHGWVCVKYWVGTKSWGDIEPEFRFIKKTQELQIKVEPQAEGEEVTWKKFASISHTYIYVCPSCGGTTLTKPSICPSCEFKESSDSKFAAKDIKIEEGETFNFEAVIPKQKADKFVMFTIYCTSAYGIENYSDYYTYTVQP